MYNLKAANIPLEKVLLDPNNYRFQEEDDFQPSPPDRFHLEANQNRAMTRLREDNAELRKSILANGFLEVERIIVSPYTAQAGYYVTIEGNRRIAALRQLKAEVDGSLIQADHLLDVFAGVPCLVSPENDPKSFFREALMGIRHVGGIKQWGGFERAKLVADLRDKHGLAADQVAERVGLPINEVNRRYRAFKALQQMQDDDDFGDRAKPSMYPLFHEAVALPVVREWLGWNGSKNQFENTDALHSFYDLITPNDPEETGSRDPKIRTYQDVRALRDIVTNPQARSYLLDPARSFFDALAAARQAEISRKWKDEVRQATTALENIGLAELSDIKAEDVAILNNLKVMIDKVLQFQKARAS